jgi:hypothetical protein
MSHVILSYKLSNTYFKTAITFNKFAFVLNLQYFV